MNQRQPISPALARLACVLTVLVMPRPALSHASPSATAAPPEVFAVVIGWNGGNRQLPALRFADDDATRFAAFFRGLATPERPGRIWLLTELDERTTRTLSQAGLDVRPDGPPTRDNVLATLRTAATHLRQATPGARRVLYVVYAGHGLRGRVLLKPTGSDEAALTGTELRTALAEASGSVRAHTSAAQVFVFLDACRSESLFADRGDAGGSDFGAAISDLEKRANALSIGVLTAARSGRPAGEVARLEAGYFSHVLGSGLAGGADADGDDVVSFGELAAFVAFHTQKLTGQLPWFDPPDGDLEVGAMDHRGRRSRLVLPGDADGHFLVSAGAGAQGRPVFAEAYQDRGRRLRLTLPPGRYRIARNSKGQPGSVATVELGSAGLVDLATAAWHSSDLARGDATAAGDDGADDDPNGLRLGFSSQFSSDVVSTLAAGYFSGRKPQTAAGRTALALDLGLAAGRFTAYGPESRLALRLAHSFGMVDLALVARAARSAHERGSDSGAPLSLYHLGLGIEAQLPFRLAASTSWSPVLAPFLSGGWGALLLRSHGPTAGDLNSPWFEGGVRASWAVGGPAFVTAALAYSAAFVTVDGRRERIGAPAFALGAGVVF